LKTVSEFFSLQNSNNHTVSFGCGNSIFRSSLPERNKAGSRISTRFVAAITLYNKI
jgi:hypothetical protein